MYVRATGTLFAVSPRQEETHSCIPVEPESPRWQDQKQQPAAYFPVAGNTFNLWTMDKIRCGGDDGRIRRRTDSTFCLKTNSELIDNLI